MSFQVPQNVPSFSSAQRPYEDGYWQTASRTPHANGYASKSVGSRLSHFLSEGQQLPMYKDKPHFVTRRRRGIWQRKRTYGITFLVALAFTWWFGILGAPRSLEGVVPRKIKDVWSWLPSGESVSSSKDKWEERRNRVREAFVLSWDGYEKYAWGLDEYHPVSKKGRNMVENGMGWTIVDALDTAIMMNLTSRVKHAREWIATSLNYNANHEVNTFETTIRMLGGLLSAHYLSTTFPSLAPLTDDDINQPGEDLYIEKATDLADRILGAFDSQSGIPFASVNLNTSQGIPAGGESGASSTAEAATLQLEFKYLSKLTGETHYWEKVEKVMRIVDGNHRQDGLLPIYINPTNGQFRGELIRLGSRGDSYYEYLIKQYLQTSGAEKVYLDMWNEALEGIKRHLLTYTKHASLTIIGERQSGLSHPMTPKMDHLVCFMPGTIALAVTGGTSVSEAKVRLGKFWTKTHDENLQLAKELMKTCWGMYKVTATGLAPEISYFDVDDPPRQWIGDMDSAPISSALEEAEDADWRQDYDIHANDVHNLQRPETVESLLYLYRITGDTTYREWGWEMFTSFIKHTKVIDGKDIKQATYAFTSLDDVMHLPAKQRDNMESFWLAETLKYFYLLFSPTTEFPLHQVVVNTEAHFLPRFEMANVFKTGWQRSAKEGGAKEAEEQGRTIDSDHPDLEEVQVEYAGAQR